MIHNNNNNPITDAVICKYISEHKRNSERDCVRRLFERNCEFDVKDNTVHQFDCTKIKAEYLENWKLYAPHKWERSKHKTFCDNLEKIIKVTSTYENEAIKKIHTVAQSLLGEIHKKIPMIKETLTPINSASFPNACKAIGWFTNESLKLLSQNINTRIEINKLEQLERDLKQIFNIWKIFNTSSKDQRPFLLSSFSGYMKEVDPLSCYNQPEDNINEYLFYFPKFINKYTTGLISHTYTSVKLKAFSESLKQDLQETFKNEYNNTVQEACEKILSDQPFEMILEFIAKQRKMMAKKVYNQPACDFGKLRTKHTRFESSPLRGKFSTYFERVKQAIGDKREFNLKTAIGSDFQEKKAG